MNKWMSKEVKLSHPNKTLEKHILEVKSFLHNLLKFYRFDENYFKVGDFLSEYHDSGKLHVSWEVGKKRGHSHLSYQYLLEKDIKLKEEIDPILYFLILKHHSPLSKRIRPLLVEINGESRPLEIYFEVLKEEVNMTIEKLGKEKIVNLVDVFGLFKIADILSASYNSANEEEMKKYSTIKAPEVREDIVRKLIGRVDERRWSEQTMLKYLPEIGILRAYTGWGKTSVGLLFFENKQPLKIFYLMPTITAINSFFLKMGDAVGEGCVSKYFYFLDTEVKEEDEAISNLFFYENFMTPYVITTVDQFLLSFLQVGKYYTKRVMFREAGLIVDEVHLLNPVMLELILYFLQEYKDLYNLKVLFMSATLPSYLARYITERLQLTNSSFIDFSHGYKEKRRVAWMFVKEEIEKHIEKIVNEKEKGRKVLVVVNTVEKAVKIGMKLEEYFKLKYGEDFLVLHARFMYLDRKEKEKWIEENKHKPHILIATQVCEVSLDISYDIIFTEIAPLQALIQRFGRVNRNGEKTEDINCYIFELDLESKENVKKGNYPYSEEEIEYARKVCEELEGFKLANEWLLLEKLEKAMSYEKFVEEIKETCRRRKLDVESWKSLLKFFYSFDIEEEEIRNVLNYRDGFTVMIIPAVEMIEEAELQLHVKNLIEKDVSSLSFQERRKYFALIKEIAVSIPIWWVKKEIPYRERGFPIFNIKNKIYTRKYGIYDVEMVKGVW